MTNVYKVVWDIKNSVKLDNITRKRIIDEYSSVYNNWYCTLCTEEYYKRVNKMFEKLNIDKDQYNSFISLCNTSTVCKVINENLEKDHLLKYKVGGEDAVFIGVLKTNPEIEISFYLVKE